MANAHIYQTIRTERCGPSLVITIARAERRNAISMQTMHELISVLKEGETDAQVRGIILTGGLEYFSAGADLNDALAIKAAHEGVEYFEQWHELCHTIETLAKPVLAAIEGFCLTGGCELALACDLRIAGQGASFAITSARIGTVAGAGGTQRLPRIVGIANALEILFSADPIDAAEAYRIGLINRLVDRGGALDAARRLVEVYAERAPLSLAFVKRAVYRGMQMDLASGLEFEAFLVTAIYGTEDKQEGISSFLQKRKPAFKGR